MNVVALPVDDGYSTLGHLIEQGQAIEAIRMDGTSLHRSRGRRPG
jgi:hypothetical protein